MRKFKVEKIQYISYNGKLKGGWSTMTKLNELLQEKWPNGQVAELNHGFPYEAPVFEFSADVTISLPDLNNLIDEAEKYGIQKNAEDDAEYRRGETQGMVLHNEVEKAGKEFVINWSMTAPSLDDVAINGDAVLLHEGYARDDAGEDQEVVLIEKVSNPTWRQIGHLCNDMLSKTFAGDHIFMEGLYDAPDYVLKRLAPNYPDLQDAKVYQFCMGS